MLHARVLLTFVGFTLGGVPALGCASAPAAAVTTSHLRELRRAPVAAAGAQPAQAVASACQATPSTVYGDEPVVFQIQGTSTGAPVALLLKDERGHAIAHAWTPVSGHWQPPASLLKSGDFRLELGASGASCMVTVNRELSRATEAAR